MVRTFDYDVLVATYNGAKYLDLQLSSILSQTIPPSSIIVSDDNSCDMTVDILRYWSSFSDIQIKILPTLSRRLGSCRNFERLLSASKSSYVMLADQDDIWDRSKAEILLNSIHNLESKYSNKVPLLIHSDLRLIDDTGLVISSSFFRYQHLNPRKDSFLDIASQNVVTGCSLLVNRACIDLAIPFSNHAILHDWWLALIASRLGRISFFMQPCISYRQHSSNLVGAKGFFRLVLSSLQKLLDSSTYDLWIGAPIRQLQAINLRYPYSSKIMNDRIQNLSHSNPFIRIISALNLGLTKHGLLRTLTFYIILLAWVPNNPKAYGV